MILLYLRCDDHIANQELHALTNTEMEFVEDNLLQLYAVFELPQDILQIDSCFKLLWPAKITRELRLQGGIS